MKTLELNKFTGVRNDLSPERFDLGDLVEGVNVELDETGKPYRRLGTTVVDTVPTHSLYADGDLAFCVRGGTLRRVLPDLSTVDFGAQVLGTRVAYSPRIQHEVFCTDGYASWVLTHGGFRQWGITPPAKPSVSLTIGEMQAGTYLVTLVYVRAGGIESGASPVISVPVGANQGMALTLPVSSDPTVQSTRLYVSDCNGEVPYFVAEYANATSFATLTNSPVERTLAVRTLRMGPPPAGQVVGVYKGRTYVADNTALWYSQPYEMELFHRMNNFISFTSPVRTFAPVSDGIFIGSEEETVFLAGDAPESFEVKPVADFGTLLGTEQTIFGHYYGKDGVPGKIQLWMSNNGLCAGLDGGEFKNLTGGRYVPPSGVSSGASLFKVRGGTPQLVTTMFS